MTNLKIRETFLGYEVVGYVTSYNGDTWEVIVDTFQTRKEAETFLERSAKTRKGSNDGM